MNRLFDIRKELHHRPEISGNEVQTAKKIAEILQIHHPDKLITELAGNGIIASFEGKAGGPTVLFRCELDALPINEKNRFVHRSITPGVSHKCGHDGHMAIMLGLAEKIAVNRPGRGKVLLLFQPAEETGEGAGRILKDKKFQMFLPDYAFAIHNYPGYEKNKIILREGIFAPASKGMIINLTGQSCHAAEPEKGKNPATAISGIIHAFMKLQDRTDLFSDQVRITPVYLKSGEKAFGTSPGEGEVFVTLRAYNDPDMEILTGHSEELVKEITSGEELTFAIAYQEEFTVVINHKDAVKRVEKVALEQKRKIIYLPAPFPFSEDFSRFLEKSNGAIIGIGAGKDHPPLHSPGYDFPDEIIPIGIGIFFGLYKEILDK